MALLDVKSLHKSFPVYGGMFGRKIGEVRAVDDVSFTVQKGEILGLVGESGCGKSTAGRTIMRLYKPTEGEVFFDGKNLFKLSSGEMRKTRKDLQMVFQDPFASLNPRRKIAHILEEPLIVHKIGTSKERKERVQDLLRVVGLSSFHGERYPHQFSGGQRQRIGIARALSTRPKLIIADEPVSALDVSIQSQVLNLMMDLQEQFSLTYIFIAHDLSVVKHISHRIGVMYLGKMIELAARDELYSKPLHPYTQALLSAVPVPDPEAKRERIILQGDVPGTGKPPAGCAFHPRCPHVLARCKEERPVFEDVGSGHMVACHLMKEGR